MQASQIDPRTATSELDDPAYRVYFVDSTGATDEWRLEGAPSVEDVIGWARSDGRKFTVFAEWPRPSGPGLIRLYPALVGFQMAIDRPSQEHDH